MVAAIVLSLGLLFALIAPYILFALTILFLYKRVSPNIDQANKKYFKFEFSVAAALYLLLVPLLIIALALYAGAFGGSCTGGLDDICVPEIAIPSLGGALVLFLMTPGILINHAARLERRYSSSVMPQSKLTIVTRYAFYYTILTAGLSSLITGLMAIFYTSLLISEPTVDRAFFAIIFAVTIGVFSFSVARIVALVVGLNMLSQRKKKDARLFRFIIFITAIGGDSLTLIAHGLLWFKWRKRDSAYFIN